MIFTVRESYFRPLGPSQTWRVLYCFDSETECAADEEEGISSTGRLFLRNLPFTTTEAELSEAFSDYGDLQEVHLVLDRSEFH